MKKDNHPNWNGGVTYHNEGYRMLFRPEHPNCNQRGYVYEHRLVMEKKLGRYLHTDEVVDHLNGNKTDNTLKNLFLTNQPEHMRRHYDNRQIDSLGRFFIK